MRNFLSDILKNTSEVALSIITSSYLQMVLETLGWGKEPREDVSFVLESRLNFTQPMDSVNWRNLFSIKMSPISAQLITLGQNTLAPSLHHVTRDRDTCPRFPRETGCREAALLLLKEKGGRYSVLRDPLMLDRCVVSWEAEWEDCFELTEFTSKESYIFKVTTIVYTCSERAKSQTTINIAMS